MTINFDNVKLQAALNRWAEASNPLPEGVKHDLGAPDHTSGAPIAQIIAAGQQFGGKGPTGNSR